MHCISYVAFVLCDHVIFCEIFSLLTQPDAIDSHVSFSVHCPAGCAHVNYNVYGTSVYRGVCECVVSASQHLYSVTQRFLKNLNI